MHPRHSGSSDSSNHTDSCDYTDNRSKLIGEHQYDKPSEQTAPASVAEDTAESELSFSVHDATRSITPAACAIACAAIAAAAAEIACEFHVVLQSSSP
jgi:hypothetical protein